MTVEGTSMSPALPLYLASALLLCADPMSFAAEEGPTLSQALEGEMMSVPYLEVVASSPVPAGIGVGSHYGWRTSTRTGRRTFHAGADFLAERGTPVYAVRGGVVQFDDVRFGYEAARPSLKTWGRTMPPVRRERA